MTANRVFRQKAVWIEIFWIRKDIRVSMKHVNVHKKNSPFRNKVLVDVHVLVQATTNERYTSDDINKLLQEMTTFDHFLLKPWTES